MKHVKLISSWPELTRFAGMIDLLASRSFGQLDPEVEAWMRQLGGPIKKLDRFVAGFVRSP